MNLWFDRDDRFDYQALDRMLLFQLDRLMEDIDDYEYWGICVLSAHRETIARDEREVVLYCTRVYSIEPGVPCDINQHDHFNQYLAWIDEYSIHPI